MPMANPDRLTGLDASFLALEKDGAHMHVGSVLVFEGPAPDYDAFVERIERGLHFVPRYRQKLAFPPLGVARPCGSTTRTSTSATTSATRRCRSPRARRSCARSPGGCSRSSSTATKPLWEIWLVDTMADGRFALICKTHHALVDGISGVDIMTVLFDLEPDPPEPEPGAAVVAAAAAERRRAARRGARRARSRAARARCATCSATPTARAPTRAATSPGLAAMAAAAVQGAPPSPLNVRIGPHRRFAWVEADLATFKAIKDALGGTINDAVLTVVSGRAARAPDPPRARPGRHRAEGDGADLRARRRAARRARQPRLGDVRAAARSGCPTRPSASASCTPRWRG